MTARSTVTDRESASTSEAAILSRILERGKSAFSPEAAHSILQLDPRPRDHEHMNQLAEKTRAGTLSTQEDEELDSYIRVGHLPAIMQSKARKSLQNATHS